MTQQILLGTSWKMNKTTREATGWVWRFLQLLGGVTGLDGVQLFVIPPFTAIEAVKRASGGQFWLGAQNMHWDDWGAFTGEISAPMLTELGVELVELGHAERRRYFNETNETVGLKVQAALRNGLRPLVCVGEQWHEREQGFEKPAIERQVRAAFAGVSADLTGRLLVAYEPVWAIGQAIAASAADVRAMSSIIRDILADLFASAGGSIPVLYGGAVDPGNCAEILTEGRTDGLFVGRAALSPEGFIRIVTACSALSPSAGAHHALEQAD